MKKASLSSTVEIKIEASVQKCLSAACHSHNKNSTSGKERVTLSAHHFTNMALDSVPKYVTRKEGKKKVVIVFLLYIWRLERDLRQNAFFCAACSKVTSIPRANFRDK